MIMSACLQSEVLVAMAMAQALELAQQTQALDVSHSAAVP